MADQTPDQTGNAPSDAQDIEQGDRARGRLVQILVDNAEKTSQGITAVAKSNGQLEEAVSDLAKGVASMIKKVNNLVEAQKNMEASIAKRVDDLGCRVLNLETSIKTLSSGMKTNVDGKGPIQTVKNAPVKKYFSDI